MFQIENIWIYIARLLVFLFILPMHEAAHGWMAYRLGDPTAKRAGRVTLNPFKHVDPVGLIMMIALGFGWEKPVPVDPRYFKNPRRDNALVAAAGPVSNILMAFILMVVARLFLFLPITSVVYYIILILINMAFASIYLGIFNLIPLPPLDGFNVLGAFIPEKTYYKIYQYGRYSMFIVFFLMWLGVLSVPVGFLSDAIYQFFRFILRF